MTDDGCDACHCARDFGVPSRGSDRNVTRIAPPVLTRIGIPWLWAGDVERGWQFMRWNVFPIFSHIVMPGSHGYGRDRIPRVGGAVLAANHLSAVDGPLIGTFSSRAIWFMMKAELAEKPVIGEALMWTGGFPVSRDACAPESIRNARELVRTGHVVGVFPEGTRQRSGRPASAIHAGAIAIALKEQVPIIPCGVETFRWAIGNRCACCVVYGNPMRLANFPTTSAGYRAAAEAVRTEIEALWRQAHEAVTLGFPTALPDGTPRNDPTRLREFSRVSGVRRISGRPSQRWSRRVGIRPRPSPSAVGALEQRRTIADFGTRL